MVYKLISEWKSKDGKSHEITVYKYNISKDCVMRYNFESKNDYVDVKVQMLGIPTMNEYVYVQYNKQFLTEDEKALVKIGAD